MHYLTESSSKLCSVGSILISIYELRKREAQSSALVLLSNGNKKVGWDLSPGLLDKNAQRYSSSGK